MCIRNWALEFMLTLKTNSFYVDRIVKVIIANLQTHLHSLENFWRPDHHCALLSSSVCVAPSGLSLLVFRLNLLLPFNTTRILTKAQNKSFS